MTLEVVEIIGRSEQGFTKPYICRCDDGEVYFVKGRSATRRGLINEWLCANLAEAFGLPIAPFTLAEVPQELIEADLTGWLKDLSAGAVFASRKVMGQELAASQVLNIPSDLRRDVLVFDWWVHNNDRNLTARGGNVNLLWQPGQLVRDDDYQGQLKVALPLLTTTWRWMPTSQRLIFVKPMCLQATWQIRSAISCCERPSVKGCAKHWMSLKAHGIIPLRPGVL